MKIMPIMTNSQSFATDKNQNFGMSVRMSKKTLNTLGDAVRKREIDPIEFLATMHALSTSPAHYNIVQKSSNDGILGAFTRPDIVITRLTDDGDMGAVTAKVEEFLPKVQSLDVNLQSKIKAARETVESNLLENAEFLATPKQQIITETRNINFLRGLESQANPTQQLGNTSEQVIDVAATTAKSTSS